MDGMPKRKLVRRNFFFFTGVLFQCCARVARNRCKGRAQPGVAFFTVCSLRSESWQGPPSPGSRLANKSRSGLSRERALQNAGKNTPHLTLALLAPPSPWSGRGLKGADENLREHLLRSGRRRAETGCGGFAKVSRGRGNFRVTGLRKPRQVMQRSPRRERSMGKQPVLIQGVESDN
jgi:hypothetical protein